MRKIRKGGRLAANVAAVAALLVGFTSTPALAQGLATSADVVNTNAALAKLAEMVRDGACNGTNAAMCKTTATNVKRSPSCGSDCKASVAALAKQIEGLPEETAAAVVKRLEEKYGAAWRAMVEGAGDECLAHAKLIANAPPGATINAGVVQALQSCSERAKARLDAAIKACQENGGVVVDGRFSMVCDKPDHAAMAELARAEAASEVDRARIAAEKEVKLASLNSANTALGLNEGGVLTANGVSVTPTNSKSIKVGLGVGLGVGVPVLVAGLTAGLVCGIAKNSAGGSVCATGTNTTIITDQPGTVQALSLPEPTMFAIPVRF